MLSFPRTSRPDPLPRPAPFRARINTAYSTCGTRDARHGAKLTGVPINYLITVNFRGFRQVVDRSAGSGSTSTSATSTTAAAYGYATINLFPGYQRLGGYQALDFVRFRHTDTDLSASPASSVRAGVQGSGRVVRRPLDLPKIINAITNNVEVGRRQGDVDAKTVLSYARFARAAAGTHLPVEDRGARGDVERRALRLEAYVRKRGARVRPSGRRVAAEGDPGGADGSRRQRRTSRHRPPRPRSRC